VADIGRRLPAATVVLQVDEPGMPAALAGRVPTPSGYGTVRSLPASVAGAALASVLATVPPRQRLVHCCAADAPLRLFTQNGASAVSVDARRPGTPVLDALGAPTCGSASSPARMPGSPWRPSASG
jgi:hypothetical protein